MDALLPKWNKAKKESEALKNGKSFKPDIVPAIKKFDQDSVELEEAQKGRDKLRDLLKNLFEFARTNGSKHKNLRDDLEKNQDEVGEDYRTYCIELQSYYEDEEELNTDAEPMLRNWGNSRKKYIDYRKSVWDQLEKLDYEMIAAIKKTHDEYKSKSGSLEAREKKLKAEIGAAYTQIRSIADTYEKIAAKMDDTGTVKVVQRFLSSLP